MEPAQEGICSLHREMIDYISQYLILPKDKLKFAACCKYIYNALSYESLRTFNLLQLYRKVNKSITRIKYFVTEDDIDICVSVYISSDPAKIRFCSIAYKKKMIKTILMHNVEEIFEFHGNDAPYMKYSIPYETFIALVQYVSSCFEEGCIMNAVASHLGSIFVHKKIVKNIFNFLTSPKDMFRFAICSKITHGFQPKNVYRIIVIFKRMQTVNKELVAIQNPHKSFHKYLLPSCVVSKSHEGKIELILLQLMALNPPIVLDFKQYYRLKDEDHNCVFGFDFKCKVLTPEGIVKCMIYIDRKCRFYDLKMLDARLKYDAKRDEYCHENNIPLLRMAPNDMRNFDEIKEHIGNYIRILQNYPRDWPLVLGTDSLAGTPNIELLSDHMKEDQNSILI